MITIYDLCDIIGVDLKIVYANNKFNVSFAKDFYYVTYKRDSSDIMLCSCSGTGATINGAINSFVVKLKENKLKIIILDSVEGQEETRKEINFSVSLVKDL